MPLNILTKRISFGHTTVGKLLGFIVDLLIIIIIAIAASMLVKTFLVRSFYIPSESMVPTLEVNDNVLVNRLTPSVIPLEHGNIIVFKDAQNWMETTPTVNTPTTMETLTSFIMLSEPSDQKYLVKRVIGLPGDHIKCCSPDGYLLVNDKEYKEAYLAKDTLPSLIGFDIEVPKGKVWVMGDNRSNSSDSRYHQDTNGGFINESDIIGRAFVRTLPVSRFSWL